MLWLTLFCSHCLIFLWSYFFPLHHFPSCGHTSFLLLRSSLFCSLSDKQVSSNNISCSLGEPRGANENLEPLYTRDLQKVISQDFLQRVCITFCSSGNIYCVGWAFYSSCNVSLGASFAVSFQPEFDFLISAAFHANETLEITEHFDPVTNGCLTFWHFPSVTVSLEAQMVSGSNVGESHSMEYIHIPKKGLLTKSLEFGKEAKNCGSFTICSRWP